MLDYYVECYYLNVNKQNAALQINLTMKKKDSKV